MPEAVKRTRSADGTSRCTHWPHSISSSWQAPGCVPAPTCRCTASTTGGMAVAQQQRPVARPVVDQPVAVDVPLVRPVGPVDVDRERLQVAVVGGGPGDHPPRPLEHGADAANLGSTYSCSSAGRGRAGGGGRPHQPLAAGEGQERVDVGLGERLAEPVAEGGAEVGGRLSPVEAGEQEDFLRLDPEGVAAVDVLDEALPVVGRRAELEFRRRASGMAAMIDLRTAGWISLAEAPGGGPHGPHRKRSSRLGKRGGRAKGIGPGPHAPGPVRRVFRLAAATAALLVDAAVDRQAAVAEQLDFAELRFGLLLPRQARAGVLAPSTPGSLRFDRRDQDARPGRGRCGPRAS